MVNDVDPVTGTSALFEAIEILDHDLIDRLCDKGARTNNNDWQKLGEMLIDLTKRQQYEKISALVNLARRRPEIELDLDYRDKEMGRTVLHYTATVGRKDIAELYVQSSLNCDILAIDNEGLNAADIAKRHGHAEVEEYLRNQF
ncbi:hypothetical protein RFI_05959 [Reticulomyxa filosa]|uniref:Uncharacterized protein n=1 Tax=Reticulomyxa filosa TaxID=46433 RepID=X6NXX0_RETFI|nr:hypothetical protein RFI_05959 [Reticulomyxa filosa]|eukprot:ETO31160.1 hypothetical protein RFI_05959 [Reticulomyxa filosa]